MTSLMRREPFGKVQSLQRSRDRMFGDNSIESTRSAATIAPALDMYETENEFVIKLDVAGVDPADIEVTLFGDSLTIKGEIKAEADSEGKDYIWRERRSGQFVRTLEMPQIADAANVTAEFESGILTLVVPKSEEAKPKSVQIKVN